MKKNEKILLIIAIGIVGFIVYKKNKKPTSAASPNLPPGTRLSGGYILDANGNVVNDIYGGGINDPLFDTINSAPFGSLAGDSL